MGRHDFFDDTRILPPEHVAQLKDMLNSEFFSKQQKVTDDLKLFIKQENRFFVSRMFVFCDSDSTVDFWLSNGVSIPDDGLALAVHLKVGLFIFERLDQDGFFDCVAPYDAKDLMIRVNHFFPDHSSPSYQFLEFKLTEIISSPGKSA